MTHQQARRGFGRSIPLFLVGCLLVLGGATRAAAQCAYPALELLEFSYVNRSRISQNGSDEPLVENVCASAPLRQAGKKVGSPSGLDYEFEGRLLVLRTLLRWLHLDATAEAWTPLPSSSPHQ